MPPSEPPDERERLEALRERLKATQEAAARLAEEAAKARERVPPSGWDVPRAADEANEELDALVRLLATLRDALPVELRAQLADLARQLLMFVRAVLDWWIDRLDGEDRPEGRAVEVEDIPLG
jgi:hypothetical protein